MATKKAQVRLSGRFPKGTTVRLVKVRDESVLRPGAADKVVDRQRVGDDGTVTFSKGVEKGCRYFIVGNVDGQPLEVRATGRESDDASVLEQPPVQPDRVRLSDGSWADEAPEKRKTPEREVQPAPRQDQVGKGVVQRSDTSRGSAHPVDPSETLPYPRQEDVKKGVVQMSDTETGQATPIHDGNMRQEDVPAGVLQRSATPTGIATPIPDGDAVRAQLEKESSEAKATRGEPVRAAAEPLDVQKVRAKGEEPGNADPHEGGDTDAMGQPADADVKNADPAQRSTASSNGSRRRSSSASKPRRTAKGSSKAAARKPAAKKSSGSSARSRKK